MRRSSDQPGSSERQEGRLSQEGQTGRRRLAREKLRRVLAPTGKAKTREPAREPRQKPETRRTPGSAAGCNKPAKLRAEQAIKAVRNREGGTRPAPWRWQADVPAQKEKATFLERRHRSGRARLMPTERNLWKPQERALTARSGRRNWKASPSGRRGEPRYRDRKVPTPREPGTGHGNVKPTRPPPSGKANDPKTRNLTDSPSGNRRRHEGEDSSSSPPHRFPRML